MSSRWKPLLIAFAVVVVFSFAAQELIGDWHARVINLLIVAVALVVLAYVLRRRGA
jgi:hypothetical protein